MTEPTLTTTVLPLCVPDDNPLDGPFSVTNTFTRLPIPR
jgi:hypothetical protein